jgi:predicted SAM-dependent methyltransferase
VKISIGAGQRRLPGWVHLDIDPATRPDILADISAPLPLPDRSVECLLCEEVITQIPLDAAQRFMHDCRRVLRPDGVMRVLMPDLRRLVTAYLDNPQWLIEIWREQVGLPLVTGTAAEVVNVGMRAVGPFVYDLETFVVLTSRAGLDVRQVAYNESSHPAMRNIDLRRPDRSVSIYLELRPSEEVAG